MDGCSLCCAQQTGMHICCGSTAYSVETVYGGKGDLYTFKCSPCFAGDALLCCGPFRIYWAKTAMFLQHLALALSLVFIEAPRKAIGKQRPTLIAVKYLERCRDSKFNFLDYLVMVQPQLCSNALALEQS